MSDTIDLTYENDDEEEVTLTLPAKMEVCYECDGHGYVLCDGMRNHGYSQEEFNEAFDDEEDRAAYFQRGGKYDVACPVCRSKNVVPVVDETRLTAEQKVEYAKYQEWKEESDQADADFEAESRMERMMGC